MHQQKEGFSHGIASRMSRWLSYATVLTLLVSCDATDRTSPLPTETSLTASSGYRSAFRGYDSRGRPIVEPYNPRIHGPASRNPKPPKNLVADPSAPTLPPLPHAIRDHISRRGSYLPRKTPAEEPIPGGANNAEGGFAVPTGNGIYSQDNVDIDSYAPFGKVLYAPTHYPADYSCLEATLISTSDRHEYAWFNHCDEQWELRVHIEGNFFWRQNYVRTDTYGNLDVINTQVWEFLPNCWEALLFNWQTYKWDVQVTGICGTGQHGFGGWTMWEGLNFSDSSCPTISSMDARAIHIKPFDEGSNIIGEWEPFDTWAGPPNIFSGYCFTFGIYDIVHDYSGENGWDAETPWPLFY